MPEETGAIDALLIENRKFAPPAGFAANALVRDASVYEKAKAAPEAFWQTPIFHPNIHRETGKVCLGVLEEHDWTLDAVLA